MIRDINTLNATPSQRLAVMHVRFDGHSFDVPLADLGLGAMSDDARVKHALAGFLDVAPNRLDDHVVDRHANGNLTLQITEAVFRLSAQANE